jgi:hypothetical protein
MERDTGMARVEEELAIGCVMEELLWLPCEKEELGGRHCLSKEVVTVYIVIASWFTW